MERLETALETLPPEWKRPVFYTLSLLVAAFLLYFSFVDPLRSKSHLMHTRLEAKREQAAEMAVMAKLVVEARQEPSVDEGASPQLSAQAVRASLLDHDLRSVTVKETGKGLIVTSIEMATPLAIWQWYGDFRQKGGFALQSVTLEPSSAKEGLINATFTFSTIF